MMYDQRFTNMQEINNHFRPVFVKILNALGRQNYYLLQFEIRNKLDGLCIRSKTCLKADEAQNFLTLLQKVFPQASLEDKNGTLRLKVPDIQRCLGEIQRNINTPPDGIQIPYMRDDGGCYTGFNGDLIVPGMRQ